jgi:hypothetical protein
MQDTSPAAIHARCEHDAAYQYSVDFYHVTNMQIVLRAYFYPHSFADAEAQIFYALHDAIIAA